MLASDAVINPCESTEKLGLLIFGTNIAPPINSAPSIVPASTLAPLITLPVIPAEALTTPPNTTAPEDDICNFGDESEPSERLNLVPAVEKSDPSPVPEWLVDDIEPPDSLSADSVFVIDTLPLIVKSPSSNNSLSPREKLPWLSI